MVALGGLTYGIAERQEKVYSATATLVVELSASGTPNSSVSSITTQLFDTYSLLLETDEFINRIATHAEEPRVRDFEINIVMPTGSRYLNIEVTHTDPIAALTVANATADVVMEDHTAKAEARLNGTIHALNEEIVSLTTERETITEEIATLEQSDQSGSARH